MIFAAGKTMVINMAEYKINGNECLGIELGSTRIKAVLIDSDCNPVAIGSSEWENRFVDGLWTYSVDDIWNGIRSAYADLKSNVLNKYGVKITKLSAMGFSGMMHGYMPFDNNGKLLVPFRTWRNTVTADASARLTELFGFNIPQRWSISHFYQAVLNKEAHIENVDFITTVAGYVHWKLSGEKVIGIGEASGMFPVDSFENCYDREMLNKFNDIEAVKEKGFDLRNILPEILTAGDNAGFLTAQGALLIDPDGDLSEGIAMCPPEGDAGTGMVATDSVRVKTGNVSAGTSIFSMVVIDKPLNSVYEEIDMVTTPDGSPVAMVHCNNCCSDLDCWVNLFYEFSRLSGEAVEKSKIYDILYRAALDGENDGGGLVSYNFFSGEPVIGFSTGIPVFARSKNSSFNLPNFMRTHLYSAMAVLKIGMEILEKEQIEINAITGHGGLFKTEYVGQKLLADALGIPVSVMETAGEGGAWGIAVLAQYMCAESGLSLADYLDNCVFSKCKCSTVLPDTDAANGFKSYLELYKKGLIIAKTAADRI